MHSVLYKKWLKLCLKGNKLSYSFLKENVVLTKLSKEDILEFEQNEIYGNYFMNVVVPKNFDYFFRLFSPEEFRRILKKTDTIFKDKLILFFLEHLKEYESYIQILFSTCSKSYWFYSFLPKIYKICELEPRYFDFINPDAWGIYLKNTKELDSNILTYLWNNQQLMDALFQYIFHLSREDIPRFLNILKYSVFYDELFLRYKKDIYWQFLLNKRPQKKKDKLLQKKYQVLLLILEDILRMEQMSLYELVSFKEGSYSNTFLLKDYILKLGTKHKIYPIENTSSFLYPMTRKQIDELNLYLEITQIVDVENITEEDVYQVFFEEREKKNVWMDPKIENIGRLKKENNSYPFSVEPWTIGFLGEEKLMKKAGEFVILDLDLLWKENSTFWEEIVKKFNLPWYGEMEKRYQNERKLTRKREI